MRATGTKVNQWRTCPLDRFPCTMEPSHAASQRWWIAWKRRHCLHGQSDFRREPPKNCRRRRYIKDTTPKFSFRNPPKLLDCAVAQRERALPPTNTWFLQTDRSFLWIPQSQHYWSLPPCTSFLPSCPDRVNAHFRSKSATWRFRLNFLSGAPSFPQHWQLPHTEGSSPEMFLSAFCSRALRKIHACNPVCHKCHVKCANTKATLNTNNNDTMCLVLVCDIHW